MIYLYEDKIGSVELIDSMGDDLRVINAARVSYGKNSDSWSEKDAKLLKYMLENKHTSVFEHCVMTFRFKVPMFVRSQHHRHRTWSFNEISRRYTSEDLEFYIPKKDWRIQSASSKQASEKANFTDDQLLEFEVMFTELSVTALARYNWLINNGVAREQARMILPQNLYTEYYGTIDLKNAIDFLRLRLHPHAQLEIQKVAEAMKVFMTKLYPETMKLVTF